MLVVGVYILKLVTPTRSEPELPPTVLTRSHVVVTCPLRSRPQHTQSSDNHRANTHCSCTDWSMCYCLEDRTGDRDSNLALCLVAPAPSTLQLSGYIAIDLVTNTARQNYTNILFHFPQWLMSEWRQSVLKHETFDDGLFLQCWLICWVILIKSPLEKRCCNFSDRPKMRFSFLSCEPTQPIGW